MSCEGCIYSIGKEATCDFSYSCNTTGRPVQKRTQGEDTNKKKSKKGNKKDLMPIAPPID
jgi:hypothetical protein